MTSEVNANGAARPQPAKRSLFNKPAWSKPQPVEEEGVDLFSRSHQVYAEVVHEQEDRRRKKLARNANRSSHEREKSNEPGRKKRRIDDPSRVDTPIVEIDSDDSVKNSRKKRSFQDSEDSPSRSRVKISPSSTRREKEPIVNHTTTQKTSITAPIELSDDDDVQPIATSSIQQDPGVIVGLSTGGAAAQEEEEAMSDEEFPELARQARARAKAKQVGGSGPTASGNPTGVNSTPGMSRTGATSGTAPTPDPDVKVDILITSQIPNTKPLIVQRRTHQNLRDVRFAWCTHQNFDAQKTSEIFLTWRGKRLFDVTTCKSLGIGVTRNDDGVLLGGGENWLGDENLHVHMEAMTVEIFEAAQKARGSGKRYTYEEEEDQKMTDGSDKGGDDSPKEKKEEQIRIILKGKGYEDFKLIVKPSTKVSRIQSAFRQARKIEAERDVFLMFDGDKLGAEDTVGNTEISDLDHIDIHVK
ncbi:MAG: hypothetical protein M1823_003241 [Watsoniomyces obsoletus]|nr:MAG: hypothetical protein M1823_003241 [Watsoniomyces obsoletus]